MFAASRSAVGLSLHARAASGSPTDPQFQLGQSVPGKMGSDAPGETAARLSWHLHTTRLLNVNRHTVLVTSGDPNVDNFLQNCMSA